MPEYTEFRTSQQTYCMSDFVLRKAPQVPLLTGAHVLVGVSHQVALCVNGLAFALPARRLE